MEQSHAQLLDANINLHFTHEETEAQSSAVTCPRQQS